MKHIVTGGCSFSETKNCVDYTVKGVSYDNLEYDTYKPWPLHLEDVVSNSKVHNECVIFSIESSNPCAQSYIG